MLCYLYYTDIYYVMLCILYVMLCILYVMLCILCYVMSWCYKLCIYVKICKLLNWQSMIKLKTKTMYR